MKAPQFLAAAGPSRSAMQAGRQHNAVPSMRVSDGGIDEKYTSVAGTELGGRKSVSSLKTDTAREPPPLRASANAFSTA